MSVEVHCPHCSMRLTVDAQPNEQVSCPGCQQLFVMGAEAAGASGSGEDVPSWYMSGPDGQQFGPVTRAKLDGWVREGRVDHRCQILHDSWSNWRSACDEYPALRPASPPPSPPPKETLHQPVTSGFSQTAVAPMAGRYHPHGYHVVPVSGLAVSSMVLGIVGLALFCIWWLAIPCDAIALVLGSVAIGETKRGRKSGHGMAIAGIVCAIVSIAIYVVIFLIAGATFARWRWW